MDYGVVFVAPQSRIALARKIGLGEVETMLRLGQFLEARGVK